MLNSNITNASNSTLFPYAENLIAYEYRTEKKQHIRPLVVSCKSLNVGRSVLQ